MSTAFVLSGGGTLGAVQVGMLQALAERKVTPDLLVGTSAGALNAAFIAGHGIGRTALPEFADSWLASNAATSSRSNPYVTCSLSPGARGSMCSEDGLSRLVAGHLTFSRLEDAAIPVHIVTTSLLSGEEVLLSRGDALTAVLASAAIPGVFPPVRRNGRILVDGGLADNAAISQAVALGADRVFVLSTGYACALTEPSVRPVGVALQALGLLIQQRLIADVALYADRANSPSSRPCARLTFRPPTSPRHATSSTARDRPPELGLTARTRRRSTRSDCYRYTTTAPNRGREVNRSAPHPRAAARNEPRRDDRPAWRRRSAGTWGIIGRLT